MRETVIEGLTGVCCIAQLPDGDLLVGEQDTGTIHRLGTDGETTEIGAVHSVTLGPGRSLLGLAVDPASSGDVMVYAYYSRSTDARIGSYTYDEGAPDGDQLTPSNESLVSDIPYGATRNGGALGFGPDGLLYAATGDTGDPGLAQDPGSYAGKILRMTSAGDVPDGNPDAASLVYSSGHTDVRGLAWDAADPARLWAMDAGDGTTAVPPSLSVIVPGQDYSGDSAQRVHTWDGGQPAGLVYGVGSRSLWVAEAGGDGVWRVPLDGEGGVVAEPVLLGEGDVVAPLALAAAGDDGVWVLGADGRVLRLDVT